MHCGQQVDQNAGILIVAMQRTNGMQFPRRHDTAIAGFTHHLPQQQHIGFQIDDDQDAGGKHGITINHHCGNRLV
jgi:hypothetical protein